MDAVLRADIEALAKSKFFRQIEEHSTVLVTGATGLIGSITVKALAGCGRQLRVLALVRSVEKAQRVFGDLLTDGLVKAVPGDVTEPLQISGEIDYIIHGASATSSRYFVERPVETIDTALKGTRNVLELARGKKVKKMVYLSSLEVYGTPDGSKDHIGEADYGYIDPIQVRSSYSEGKRMAECLCAAYASEYGVPVTVARLSQTFGAGVDYQDGRVFAEFARCAIEGRDIVLHTQGRTVRSYCCTTDAVEAIVCLMLHGNPGEAYNVTNMDTVISIRDMAQLVCGLASEKIGVIIDIPENAASYGYNPEMVIRLDSSKLQSLGWKAQVDLTGMFTRLIGSMRSGKSEEL